MQPSGAPSAVFDSYILGLLNAEGDARQCMQKYVRWFISSKVTF